jgi:cytochrome d ubiquinol oxidase subunit II
MSLHNVWFVIIAIFWAGFFVLEGFDFGVGILHTFVGRTDAERQAAIATIGPVWDGNEVWLVVAGAATFAAFPSWYATWFSALYLALLLVLVSLIVRGVSFEFHHRVTQPRWRKFWTWSLTVGSALIPLLIGVALGDLLHGLPINKSQEYTGTFWNLLTGYGLWVGLTLLTLSVLHGATFLVLKTTGDLQARARHAARRVAAAAVFAVLVFVVWSQALGHGVLPGPLQIAAVLAVAAAAWSIGADHEGWAFASTALAIAFTIGSIFVHLFPTVMVSSTNAKFNLTVSNSAAGSYALQVMTIVAVVFFPLVLLYQAWTYHVFRGRITAPPATAATPPQPDAAPTPSAPSET